MPTTSKLRTNFLADLNNHKFWWETPKLVGNIILIKEENSLNILKFVSFQFCFNSFCFKFYGTIPRLVRRYIHILLKIKNIYSNSIHFFFQKQPPEVFSKKKVFLRILQILQGNACARVSFLTLLKKRLWYMCFPVNFAKILRTPFLQNTSGGCFCSFFKDKNPFTNFTKNPSKMFDRVLNTTLNTGTEDVK